jgi:hypothetical protein
MSTDYINIHVRSDSQAAVQAAIAETFAAYGFAPVGDEAASIVADDEDRLPEGMDWYGVLVSASSDGWVSVYVDDWQDSGVLARALSQSLSVPALEVWVAEEAHWGYTYFEDGSVRDRFADDPSKVADTPDEVAALVGHAPTLTPILRIPAAQFTKTLRDSQDGIGEFVGPSLDALAQAVGLSFEHLLIGYESFFEDDPDDYGPALEDWPRWRHLAFRHPQGREQLAD